MTFSILVPVYNAEVYLSECLDSILRQKVNSYEVILVDDGSTDKSGEICDFYVKRYPDYFRVLHKKNEGCLWARRDAIQLAKGDYLLFCDADDYYTENALSILSEMIARHSPDIVLYNLELVNDNGKIGRMNKQKVFYDDEIIDEKDKIYENLLLSNFICSSMSMKCVRRGYGWENRSYKEFIGLNYGEDLLQSLDIYTLARKIIYCDKEIYCYRVGCGMTGKFSAKFYEDFKKIYYEIEKYESQWKIQNFSEQLSFFYLYLIYSTIRQFTKVKLKKEEIIQYLSMLLKEKEFLISYENYFSRKRRLKNMKMKMSLWLLKNEHVMCLYFLIKLVRNGKGIRSWF